MDLYPQPVFTAEQAAAGTFWGKKVHLFQKGAFWSTQALFTAEQVAAGTFMKNDMPF